MIEDPRCRVFLASRATHRAVFVVSKIDAVFAERMKFDRFLVSRVICKKRVIAKDVHVNICNICSANHIF